MADVVAALRTYNVEVSAGQFGGMPAVEVLNPIAAGAADAESGSMDAEAASA